MSIKLVRHRRKIFGIGCQLVAPGTLLYAVDPRIEAVLAQFKSQEEDFGAGQDDHCSFHRICFERDRSSFFDGEFSRREIGVQNLAGSTRKLE